MLTELVFWGLDAIRKVMLRSNLSSFTNLGAHSVCTGIASVAGTLSVIFTRNWLLTAYRWADERNCAKHIEAVARKRGHGRLASLLS